MKLSLLIVLQILSGDIFSQTYFNDLEQPDSSGIWINSGNIDSSFALSGKYSAITDSLHPYGLGVEMSFRGKVKNKNTLLFLKGFVLSDTVEPNALYVITIENNGETAFWKGVPLQKIITGKERWFEISDTVLIPASITKTGKLKIYLWNRGKKSPVFVDDLSISFEPYQNPSFLKDVLSIAENINPIKGEPVFKNNFYQIINNDTAGFIIADTAGSPIIKSLRYFYNETSNGGRLNNIAQFKKLAIRNKKEGKTLFRFKTKTNLENVMLEMTCYDNSPSINVKVTQKYRKKTTVTRSALVMNYALPIEEVFRANRKSDVNDFKDEYWLDKQGFQLGNDTTSITLYHCPDISSLQLDTQHKLAIINLDYEKDHPYLQFPLDADTFDLKTDKSTAIYQKGDSKTVSFKIFAGIKPEPIPKLMKNPDGFLATYIWTEHADWTDIRTHRATYFGSEKIKNADSAVGGFVKYNIPVTKSVFYDNPDSVQNTKASDSLFTSLEPAIKTDSSFKDFLFQINKKGSEICLHTPEHYTSNAGRLEEALSYMKIHFNSPTWIDHGYNNLPRDNREDFVCSGMQNFASQLWKKYDIRYFWNPYYEDYQIFMNWGFFGSIENFYDGYGDFFPKPDYWQHPTRTKDFFHWPTASVLFIGHETLWDYYFSKHQFNTFINDWGVKINHCYPAWTMPGKGFWKFSSDGTIVAMEGFNKTLSRMAGFRNEGLLNVTTVEHFLDYQVATGKIVYDVLPDGRITIINKGAMDIKGLSFAVNAKAVLVNGLKPAQKTADNELIFWFDLKSGQKVIIRTVR